MVLWKIIIISAAVLTGNISIAKKSRIVNGDDANIEDFPYQASFRHRRKHICGGSIITERHILTAAHCGDVPYIYPPYDKQTVVTGTSSVSNGGNSHQIADIAVHPDYFNDGNRCLNYIAIITLKDKIIFDKYQQKINLPLANFKVGQNAILTGWGRTQQTPAIRLDELQKLETKIISTEECQKGVNNPERVKIYDVEVCTINPNGFGPCSGDSGGPLVANDELVGIVSWSDGAYCASEHPDVYTNVYKFKDFIKSVVNNTIENVET